MIKSMTGFAAVTREDERSTIGVTVRALNHRHLDLQIRIPQSLATIEGDVRGLVAKHVARGRIWLKVNGSLRQDADVSEMISNVPELIAELSTFFELRPGDLIYTGTPAGVGPLKPGDHVEGGIDGVGTITITIGSPIAGPSTGTSA